MKKFFLTIKYCVFLSMLLCVTATMYPTVGTYMHDAELMHLVHGNFKGTLLYVWDTTIVQHPLTTLACIAALTGVVMYECSSMVNNKFQALIAAVRAEVRRIEMEQTGRIILGIAQKLELIKKSRESA